MLLPAADSNLHYSTSAVLFIINYKNFSRRNLHRSIDKHLLLGISLYFAKASNCTFAMIVTAV